MVGHKPKTGCVGLFGHSKVERGAAGGMGCAMERSGVFDGEAEREGKTPWSTLKQRMPPAWACAVAGD